MRKPQFPSFGSVRDELRSLCAQLNDCFAQVQDYLGHTVAVDYQKATAPATADEPFRVSHNLGETPRFVSAIMEAAGSVYATQGDRTEWTTTYIKIRCSVANAGMVVKVEA